MNELNVQLLERYLTGNVDEAEKDKVESWLVENNLTLEQLQQMLFLPQGVKAILLVDPGKSWAVVEATLAMKKSKRITFYVMRIAAAILILMSVGAVLYLTLRKSNPADHIHIVANATSSPLKAWLPDSSLVYIRQGSQISYTDNYRKERILKLQGEAFFEVRHNPENAFVVDVDKAQVMVVGTSFDVRDNQKQLDVIVATGRVSVYTPGNKHVYLDPGERSTFVKDANVITKFGNDDANHSSWRTGVLEFNNTPITKVATSLERHYNVSIVVRGKGVDQLTYTSKFENSDLSDVLDEMREVLGVIVRKDGSKITIILP